MEPFRIPSEVPKTIEDLLKENERLRAEVSRLRAYRKRVRKSIQSLQKAHNEASRQRIQAQLAFSGLLEEHMALKEKRRRWWSL